MNVELVKEVIEYLRAIAEPIATAGYELVLKQVYFNLACNTFYFILVIVGLVFSIRAIKRWRKINEDVSFPYTTDDWMVWIGGTGITICGLMVLFIPPYIFNALINPDWVAIKMILDIIQ